MSSKTKKSSNAKATQKKTNFLPVIAAAAVIICVAVVFLVNGNGTSNESNGAGRVTNVADTAVSIQTPVENNETDRGVNGSDTVVSGKTQTESNGTDRENNGVITIAFGESLVIPTADITSDVSFFPLEVDGTAMEVIAVKASDGTIRTAFNTCQVCYDSGRGYYAQSGNYLVCQNCGNRFSMDQVEIESGGCNPWPIFDENKTVMEDEISISYDFLAEAQGIFANWKGSY